MKRAAGCNTPRPWTWKNGAELDRRWAELRQRADAEGKDFRVEGLDKKIKELVDAESKYRLLTYDPKASKGVPPRFYNVAAGVWRKLNENLQASRQGGDDESAS